MSRTARILLVDDNLNLRQAVSSLLKKAGHEVIEAETGTEGLHLAKAQKPDLVLLDVVLPDVNGIEVCRRIKGDPALTGCFVVLFSGVRTLGDDQADGLEAGADGYIARPISSRELLARVEAVLRIRRAEAEDAYTSEALRKAHAELEIEHQPYHLPAPTTAGCGETDRSIGENLPRLAGTGPRLPARSNPGEDIIR